MGINERKQREKQRRVNEILDAAEAVFFSDLGISASMDEVAEKAEVSKGTLYLYFKNKESLLLGIGVRANIVAKEYLQKGVDRAGSGMMQILEALKSYYLYSQKYPHYFKLKSFSNELMCKPLCQRDGDPQAEKFFESGLACANTLSGALERGIKDGSIRKDIDPLATTFLIWAQITGVIKLIDSMHETLNEEFNIESDYLLKEFLEFVKRSLEGKTD